MTPKVGALFCYETENIMLSADIKRHDPDQATHQAYLFVGAMVFLPRPYNGPFHRTVTH